MNRVTRELLANPALYLQCAEAAANVPGVMARNVGGGDEGAAETPAESQHRWLVDLARTVGSGQYTFGAPSSKTKTKAQASAATDRRPLADQLVLAALALLLETLAEPHLPECAFGFRRNREAAEALAHLRRQPPEGRWAVAGDLGPCFDSLDPQRLVSLALRRCGGHQIFADLLRSALRSGAAAVRSSWSRNAGTPAGSPLDPLLAHLYLAELERFVAESPELRFLREPAAAAKGAAAPGKGAATKASGTPAKASGTAAAAEPRLRALRYADCFAVFLEGSRTEALELRQRLRSFLRGQLELRTTPTQLALVDLRTDGLPFLLFRLQRTAPKPGAPERLRLNFAPEPLLWALVERGLLRRRADGRFFPTSHKPLLAAEPATIVAQLGRLFGALAATGALGDNWAEAKTLVTYWGRYVAAMTLAHKTKSTVAKVFAKYGDDLAVRDGDGAVLARWPTVGDRSSLGAPPPEPSGGGKNPSQLLERLLRWARREESDGGKSGNSDGKRGGRGATEKVGGFVFSSPTIKNITPKPRAGRAATAVVGVRRQFSSAGRRRENLPPPLAGLLAGSPLARRHRRQALRSHLDSLPPPNDFFWQWLGGLVDGDGCFWVDRSRYVELTITAATRELPMLAELWQLLGGNVAPEGTGKRAFHYSLRGDYLKGALPLLAPQLQNPLRRKQLTEVYELWGWGPPPAPAPLAANSGWFLGFWEADGSLFISYNRRDDYPTLTLEVSNNERLVVMFYAETFGGRCAGPYGRSYRWVAQQRKLLEHLDQLGPKRTRKGQLRFGLLPKF